MPIPPLDASYYGRKFRSLTYIKTLPEVDNIPRATAIVSIKEDTLLKIFSAITADSQIGVYIFSNDKLITGINQNEMIAKTISDKLSVNVFSDSQKLKIQNNKYYAFLCSSDSIGWNYVAVIPSHIVLAQANYIAKASILLILFLMCIGLLLAYTNFKNTYKYVDNIMQTIKTILGSNDEITKEENEYKAIENAIMELFNKEQKLKQTFENNLPLLKNSYLLKILKGDFILNDSFLKMLEFLEIRLNNSFFTCITLIDINNFSSIIENKLNNSIPDWNIYVVDDGINIKSILVNSNTDNYSEIIDKVYNALSNFIPNVTAGAGNMYNSMDMLHLSYKEALNALDYKLLKGHNKIITFEEIKNNNELYYYYPRDKQDAIINCLKSNEPEKAYSICLEIIDDNIASKKLNIEAVKSLFCNILITLFQLLQNSNVGDMDYTMECKLFSLDNIHDIKNYLKEICYSICNRINLEQQNYYNKMVDEIIRDINENCFSSNLTLSYLSDKYGLTEPYLSALLKKNLGCTFMDYITIKRVEKAKELLLMNNLKIADISKMVGYESDLSFRRAFSKYTGVSPSQFKKLKHLST
ncbi:MAG TPA: helix-turn-helix transcriptional regulator [Clostridiaceae bacterium]|nr:helix-turn-helix transcriptional regulator [Clostridiaceae bacterium]